MPLTEAKDSNQDTKDKIEEDEEERSEATFRFIVKNFSTIQHSCLSETCIISNLPWRIKIMQRTSQCQERTTKSLGYFLQCNRESESSTWSCQASADLRLINQRDNTKFSRKISHLFYSKENDWGFSHYMLWNDVQDPEKGYIKDDTVIFEVHVSADAPHSVSWNSKKHTGYVGLKNQGATCYMNSLLQVLYFTNYLRRAVYKIPTESDDSQKSVGLELQRVFNELQFLDEPVCTKKLTKSFGWDSFMQHDAQEFLRVLLDKLENKMKTTCVEGTIPKLFEGKMISYIQCKNVDYKSTRTESFYDIQLNIKGKKSIEESFTDYIQTESLNGENKYDAGSYGLQDAEKGILFEKFPPVLHLHLMRFQYDPVTDCASKFNDRCEFPEVLDLSHYCQTNSSKLEDKSPYLYLLHAVLAHSGDNHAGHYVVFINPMAPLDGKWCKFDNDVVSRCSKKEAIDHNFGGEEHCPKHCTNAYMLVYINQTRVEEILCPLADKDIPEALTERLTEEKKIEMIRQKEKNEAHLYMLVRVLLEDNFHGHQGNDLFDPEFVTPIEFHIQKASTLREFLTTVSDDMKWPLDRLRPWPLTHRTNQTLRPSLVELEDWDRTMLDVSENANPWTIFLELLPPDITRPLPTFDKDQDVMLFFKYYCPRTKKIHYMGHLYLAITTKLSSVLPKLCELASIPPPENNKLLLWEEIKPNMLEHIEDIGQPLEHTIEELMDGDIIVFQEEPPVGHSYELPTARDYFRDLFSKFARLDRQSQLLTPVPATACVSSATISTPITTVSTSISPSTVSTSPPTVSASISTTSTSASPVTTISSASVPATSIPTVSTTPISSTTTKPTPSIDLSQRMWKDVLDSRSEATFRYMVKNFSTIRNSCLSDPCIISKLPWKIKIFQRTCQTQECTIDSLGYFLQCNGCCSNESSWSCQASAELRIINQRDNTKFSRKITHLFCSKENDWGVSHYMPWKDLLDPEMGYIKNDMVIFEVNVSVDPDCQIIETKQNLSTSHALLAKHITLEALEHIEKTPGWKLPHYRLMNFIHSKAKQKIGDGSFGWKLPLYRLMNFIYSKAKQKIGDARAEGFGERTEPRLESLVHYLIANEECIPSFVDLVKLALLEQINLPEVEQASNMGQEVYRNSKDMLLKEKARGLPNDLPLVKWHECYHQFRIACNYFVLGVERYVERRMEEALDLLTSSYTVNQKLLDEHPLSGSNISNKLMNTRGLLKHFHLAVSAVNNKLVEEFETGNDPQDVTERVTRILVPAIHILQLRTNNSNQGKDASLLEDVRGRWCAMIQNPLPDNKSYYWQTIFNTVIPDDTNVHLRSPINQRYPSLADDLKLEARYRTVMQSQFGKL